MITSTFDFRCALLLGSIFTLVNGAPAANAGSVLVIANDGIDSATCGSKANPCRSISQGMENATDGDTLIVLPGLYGDLNGDGDLSDPGEERFNAARNCAICIEKRLTIFSERGARVTIINIPRIPSSAFPPPQQTAVEIAAPGVFFGGQDAGFTITGDNDYGIFVNAVGNVRVSSNRVLNAVLRCEPSAGSLLVSDNSVIGANRQGGGGITVSFFNENTAERFKVIGVRVQGN